MRVIPLAVLLLFTDSLSAAAENAPTPTSPEAAIILDALDRYYAAIRTLDVSYTWVEVNPEFNNRYEGKMRICYDRPSLRFEYIGGKVEPNPRVSETTIVLARGRLLQIDHKLKMAGEMDARPQNYQDTSYLHFTGVLMAGHTNSSLASLARLNNSVVEDGPLVNGEMTKVLKLGPPCRDHFSNTSDIEVTSYKLTVCPAKNYVPVRREFVINDPGSVHREVIDLLSFREFVIDSGYSVWLPREVKTRIALNDKIHTEEDLLITDLSINKRFAPDVFRIAPIPDYQYKIDGRIVRQPKRRGDEARATTAALKEVRREISIPAELATTEESPGMRSLGLKVTFGLLIVAVGVVAVAYGIRFRN